MGEGGVDNENANAQMEKKLNFLKSFSKGVIKL